MPHQRIFFPWLAPLYQRVPFARFLAWQARFLTPVGARKLGLLLLQEFADEITFERDGVRWTFPLQDRTVGHDLFLTEKNDSDNVTPVVDWANAFGYLPRGEVILEIGANLGNTTLPLARLTHCHIVSIEPVPRALELLKRNLAQNNLTPRVTIVERALTESDGETEMIVPLVGRGGAEVVVANVVRHEVIFQAPCETIRVKTTRLDTLLQELKLAPEKIAFVWCDVQGSEGAVIRTGEPLWRAGVPLWTELAPELLRRQGTLEQFFYDTEKFFVHFFTLDALFQKGVAVPLQPVRELRALAAARERADKQMDVFLIPRALPIPSPQFPSSGA